jgi:F-type H+-transporting ATPase subunit delta
VSAISEAAARVYAGALFSLGREEGSLAEIAADLHAFADVLHGLDGDLQAFFTLPQLRREEKRRIINLAFGDKVGRPVLGLLNVLVDKRREQLFDTIVAEFDTMLDRHDGRVQVNVTSARKLDADLADALRTALEQRTHRTVVLHERIDPEVIAGLRVNIGDRVLDGTVRRRLADMRRSLAATQPQG